MLARSLATVCVGFTLKALAAEDPPVRPWPRYHAMFYHPTELPADARWAGHVAACRRVPSCSAPRSRPSACASSVAARPCCPASTRGGAAAPPRLLASQICLGRAELKQAEGQLRGTEQDGRRPQAATWPAHRAADKSCCDKRFCDKSWRAALRPCEPVLAKKAPAGNWLQTP